MTRQTAKNQINKMLHDITKGLFSDESWLPVNAAFKALEAKGFEPILTGSKYDNDENGNPCRKTWTFEVQFSKKPLYGVIIASGAGSVADPLCCYDISAYVS